MARIPTLKDKSDVAPLHHAIYDEIVGSRGQVRGPFPLLLHSPEVAGRTAHLGAYIQFESKLDLKDAELAVITAVREVDCNYAWGAHATQAKQAGVREEAIAAIRNRQAPAGLTPDEALVVTYVHQLLRAHRVEEATFRAMQDRFGLQGLVELTTIVGCYGMLACTLNAFEMEADAGADLLPDWARRLFVQSPILFPM